MRSTIKQVQSVAGPYPEVATGVFIHSKDPIVADCCRIPWIMCEADEPGMSGVEQVQTRAVRPDPQVALPVGQKRNGRALRN